MKMAGIPTINLELHSPEREKQYEQIISILSQRTGVSPEDLRHVALLVLSTALCASEGPRRVTLSIAEWRRCSDSGCRCGGWIPEILANFALPEMRGVTTH